MNDKARSDMQKEINDYFFPGETQELDNKFRRYMERGWYRNYCRLRSWLNRIEQAVVILWRNPFLLPYIFRNVSLSILGKNPMRSLEIAIEYNCNSKCEQCSCRLAYDPGKERLSMDQFKNAADQAFALGAFQFNITGGEPLLRLEEVYELISYIRAKGGYVHICSNGLLMTEEILKELVSRGLNSLEMGLDSASHTEHDINRKEESFRKIMQVIDWSKKYGLMVILNTICTKEKIKNHDLLALRKIAKEKGVYLQLTPPCVTGAWKNQIEVLLTGDDIEYFWWFVGLPRVRTDMFSSFTTVRCPAAREKIGLQPYGDIVSCPLIQIVYGNIKETSLEDIRNKMLEDPYYSKVTSCLPALDRNFINDRLIDNK